MATTKYLLAMIVVPERIENDYETINYDNRNESYKRNFLTMPFRVDPTKHHMLVVQAKIAPWPLQCYPNFYRDDILMPIFCKLKR